MRSLLQIFSVILTIFATSEALMCYECYFCDDIFQTQYIFERDCSTMYEIPSCEKIVYELDNSSRGVIARRCQYTVFLSNRTVGDPFGSKNEKYSIDYVQQFYLQFATRQNTSRPHVSRISVFHCQTDYCNITSIASGSSLIILIFILIFLLL